MRIAICDDRPDQLAQIHEMLLHYLLPGSIRPQIDLFESPFDLLDGLDKADGYDIALLDICMPGISGIGVAREMRSREEKTEIVFLTTSDEYAVSAFALKAAHYLVKPFSSEQFDEAMDRAMARFVSARSRSIAVKPLGGGVRTVDVDDIVYVESNKHVLTIVTREGSCTEGRRSLERIHEELEKVSPGQFVMPYKGYVVNQRAIASIEQKRILLRGGASVPLPRGSFRAVRDAYFDYTFGSAE